MYQAGGDPERKRIVSEASYQKAYRTSSVLRVKTGGEGASNCLGRGVPRSWAQ